MPTSFDRRSLLLTGAAAAFAGPVLAAPSPRERFDAVVAEHGKGRAGPRPTPAWAGPWTPRRPTAIARSASSSPLEPGARS
jgi:hypothetical protein